MAETGDAAVLSGGRNLIECIRVDSDTSGAIDGCISLVFEVVMVPLEGAKGRQEEGSAKDDCKDGVAPQRRKNPRVLNLFLPQVLDNVDAVVGSDLGVSVPCIIQVDVSMMHTCVNTIPRPMSGTSSLEKMLTIRPVMKPIPVSKALIP